MKGIIDKLEAAAKDIASAESKLDSAIEEAITLGLHSGVARLRATRGKLSPIIVDLVGAPQELGPRREQ